MKENDRFSDFIDSHPRESLQILVIGLFLVWQSMACVLGLVCYILGSRHFKVQWWVLLLTGIVIAAVAIFLQELSGATSLVGFIREGFSENREFWKYLFANRTSEGFLFLFDYAIPYVIGFPVLMAGILSTIDLILDSPHTKAMNALQKGIHANELTEISDKKINTALENLRDKEHGGTVLGVSKYSGKYAVINDRDVNQVLLVLGTTGGGKTITLRRFYQRAIAKGYPLIIVDGKPEHDNIKWIMDLAEKHARRFYGFNCGNNLPYDPLANGGYTELKDKIISLKDEWSSDHYRSIAEDYLQATFEVLLKSKLEFDLKRVVECLNYEELVMIAREANDQKLMQRVASLERYDKNDITGLQAHLNILIHSELGQFFEKNDSTFTLPEVIKQSGIVYFALPALRFPSFSKVLGKLVINDLKAVVDRHTNQGERIFAVFDEFSVFAGEQVLNLVNMGRGKGVHAIFGTQGLADLDKVDVTFKDQILNCANTVICHRLNDQDSAEKVAHWVGTQDAFTVTTQLNINQSNAGLGTVKRNKEFIVHPDAIKQELQTGEAFYITKVGRFKRDKVKVKFT